LPIDANSITALRQGNKAKRNLDIIVGFAWDDTAVVSGMRVDVAPTVASILDLELPQPDGRPLLEALRNGPSQKDFQVKRRFDFACVSKLIVL
jgi:hypothetical protein